MLFGKTKLCCNGSYYIQRNDDSVVLSRFTVAEDESRSSNVAS